MSLPSLDTKPQSPKHTERKQRGDLERAPAELVDQFRTLYQDSEVIRERMEAFGEGKKDKDSSDSFEESAKKAAHHLLAIILNRPMSDDTPKQTSPLAPVRDNAAAPSQEPKLGDMIKGLMATDFNNVRQDGIAIDLGPKSIAERIFLSKDGTLLNIRMQLSQAGREALERLPQEKLQAILQSNLKRHISSREFTKAEITLCSGDGRQDASGQASKGLDMIEIYFDSVKESS